MIKRIQKYGIQTILGEGSFGTVYRAVDLEDGERPVALKVLDPSLAENTEVRRRFLAEAAGLAELDHPGIPRLLAFGPHESTFFLAEELAAGPSIRSARPSIEEAVEIVAQILEVLRYAHQRGVVHRSLESSRVIATARGVKILNLGIAEILHGGVTPELTGVRADLFAVGAILHELLTGALPAARVDAGAAAPVSERSLESLRSDLPPSLLEFYRRCIAVDPRERYPDTGTALASLSSVNLRAIAEVDGLRIRVEPLFDRSAYAADDDPTAQLLLELEVSRSSPSSPSRRDDTVKADLFLVLDVSGSMNASDRYPLLRRAVEELLDRVDPGDRVGIVLFSTGADGVTPLISGADARALDRSLLQRMDRSPLMFGGGTHLAPGLRHALEALGAGRPDAVRRIYILTDGELHDQAACERLMPEARRARIEVHVYGFGSAFDAAALKRMVSDQLGGSVKPICNERDIVATFSHIADVNRRLVARDAVLRLEFDRAVDCGDAFSFRPQERWLGAIHERSLVRELGGLEEGRVYALLAEVRLPPDRDRARTPIARAELVWREGDDIRRHAVLIDCKRSGGPASSDRDPKVEQAFAILDALRREGDREAEKRALRARLELAQLEGRDPGLRIALERQLDVLEGRIDPSLITREDAQYLEADLATHAGVIRWTGHD